jgi:hypothetical protein
MFKLWALSCSLHFLGAYAPNRSDDNVSKDKPFYVVPFNEYINVYISYQDFSK